MIGALGLHLASPMQRPMVAYTDDDIDVAGDHLGLESPVGDHADIESLELHLLQEMHYSPEYS